MVDYLSASEEEQALFRDTFHVFKEYAHLKAQRAWYVWREEMIETLMGDIEPLYLGSKEVSLGLYSIIRITPKVAGAVLMVRMKNSSIA